MDTDLEVQTAGVVVYLVDDVGDLDVSGIVSTSSHGRLPLIDQLPLVTFDV